MDKVALSVDKCGYQTDKGKCFSMLPNTPLT